MMSTSVMPAETTASAGMRLARVMKVRALRKFWLNMPNNNTNPIQITSKAPVFRNFLGLKIMVSLAADYLVTRSTAVV